MTSSGMCGPESPPASSVPLQGASTAPAMPESTHELFTSDEFRLYCFKILPCSKRFSHDWPSCPFSHPGEKAKRRDPRTHQYDCEMCPAVVKGETCELGAACPHSHHVFESWLHPQKYRTLLCKDGDQCHREVCFFAHGSKQQRMTQQQRYPAMPGAGMPRNGTSAQQGRQLPAAGYPQQQQRRQAGSAGSNTAPPALVQLQGQGFPVCTAFAHPAAVQLAQQQTQLLSQNACQADGSSPLGSIISIGDGGSAGADMSQLLHSLAAEVSASQQEVAEQNRVAAAAQQKLQLLEQLLGCSLTAAGANGTAFAPVGAIPTPGTSPIASTWPAVCPAGGGQQLPPPGPQLSQLMHMQQMVAHGAYDGAYPRRHSLDEALLRRARNLPAGISMLGRQAGGANMWAASPSAALASLAEGAVLGTHAGAATAADIETLTAVLAAAGMHNGGAGGGGLANMQTQGLVSGSSIMTPSASSGSWASQMPLPDGGSAQQLWGQPGGMWGASHLPPIPHSSHAGLNTNGSSFSAPQLQSDYLLQLHAALQGGAVPPRPVRASFDVAAAYLPAVPGDLLVGSSPLGPDEALPGREDVGAAVAAAAANDSASRSTGCSIVQDGSPAVMGVPDKLVGNPIGGAAQLGWF